MSFLAWVGGTALLGAGTALVGSAAAGIYWNYDGFDPESLRGATVVVTGCSAGIGEEMAYQYARLGAKILITARRENRLKEVVAKAMPLGAQEAYYVAGDMGKAKDCEITIQTAEEKFGRLDYLVLNHLGSSFGSPYAKQREGKSWDQDPDMDFFVDFLNINLVSYVRLASLALPMLKTSNGHIVVVSSIFGFFSSLRVELMKAQQNVSITLAILGLIRTEGVEQHLQKTEQGRKMLKNQASPVDKTAVAIIRAGATRAREVYFPAAFSWTMSKLGAMLPTVVDRFLVRI